jgi:acyl-CoA synthetase (AMP-forming)/AMP-acid ligase II/thioesterase domain-containing protein/acyl carrier protein
MSSRDSPENAGRTVPFIWRTAPGVGADHGGPACVAYERLTPRFDESSIFDHFVRFARSTPDAVAVIDDDGSLTYRELNLLVQALAARIDHSAPQDHAVAALLPNTPDALVAVLACMAAGRTCLLLNAGHPPARNAAILNDAGVRVVITLAADRPDATPLPADAIIIELESAPKYVSRLARAPLDALSRGEAHAGEWPATVIYTSGSSGQAKGIVVTQRDQLARIRAYIDATHVNQGDRLLSLGPLCTSGGLTISLVALLAGASQVLVSSAAYTPPRLLALIRERAVTLLFGMPTLLRALTACDGARDALTSIRLLRTAAEPVLNDDLDAIRAALPADCHILVTYGQTEALVSQWFVPPDYARDGHVPSSSAVPSGRILAHHEFAIVDESGVPVADGEAGELVLRSRHVASGEWKMGRCTPGGIIADLDEPAARVLATGDVVRMLPGDILQVLGRRDRLLKINGYRVEPAEIEALLRRAPEVSDAAIAVRRDGHAPRIVAAVVAASADIRAGDLRRALRTRLRAGLPSWMQPARIIVVSRLPRLPDGKIDEAAVLVEERSIPRDEAADTIDDSDAPTPTPQSRASVAQAWRETLDRGSLDIDAAFDEAGGDSLQLLTLVMRLETLSGATLPLEAFHASMRPRDVARLLDRLAAERARAHEPSDLPVLFVAPGLGGYEPRLAALHAGCAATVRLIPLAYPAWSELRAAPPPSLDTFAERLAVQVEAQAPCGPVLLGGYSFGAQVAYALATVLRRRGRSVKFLAILDANAPGSGPLAAKSAPVGGWMQRLSRLARRGPAATAAAVASRVRYHVLRSIVAKGLVAFRRHRAAWPNIALRLENELSQLQFTRLSRHWRAQDSSPPPLDVPVVIFRSQERGAHPAHDLGWAALSRSVTIVPVSGTHLTMFDGPNLPALCAAFSTAVSEHCR